MAQIDSHLDNHEFLSRDELEKFRELLNEEKQKIIDWATGKEGDYEEINQMWEDLATDAMKDLKSVVENFFTRAEEISKTS